MRGTSTHPTCTHCGSTKSPLWRRGMHSEMLCNACGLYWKHHGTYRPLSLKVAADRKESSPSHEQSPGELGVLPPKRDSTLRRLRSALASGTASADAVGLRRKVTPLRSKAWRTPLPGKITVPASFFLPTTQGYFRSEPIYAPELPPSTGTANVRLVPAEIRCDSPQQAHQVPTSAINSNSNILSGSQPAPSLPMNAHLPVVKYIMFRGRLLFIGDHVAVKGDDSQIYFAIVRDFWLTPTGQKYFTLQWLLPKEKHAMQIDGPKEQIDPSFFTLGMQHDKAEPIESIVDVFFSPQSLRRPLEGPSPVPQLGGSGLPTPSRSATPVERTRRASSMDEGDGEGDCNLDGDEDGESVWERGVMGRAKGMLALSTTPSYTVSSPFARPRRRPLSDSEVELHRQISSYSGTTSISTTNIYAPFRPVSSILDDVEMAHLLCSMS